MEMQIYFTRAKPNYLMSLALMNLAKYCFVFFLCLICQLSRPSMHGGVGVCFDTSTSATYRLGLDNDSLSVEWSLNMQYQ